jgi:hypothetical protein
MAGKLIMLPLRVWLGSARLLTRTAGAAAGKAVSLAGQAIGAASPNGSDHGYRPAPATAEPPWREEPVSPVDVEHPHREPEPRPHQDPEPRLHQEAEPRPAAAPPRPRETPRDRRVSAVRPPEVDLEAPVVAEPVHVSEEPELVRAEAEPGAEDGAGARVTVMEPWKGYARMNAREVIARARQAGAAELAAVRLYESRHRSRQTVLAAVDRQLKLAGGPNAA